MELLSGLAPPTFLFIQYTINLTLNLIRLFILTQTLQPPIVSEYSQYLLDITGYCYCLSRIKYGARVRFKLS